MQCLVRGRWRDAVFLQTENAQMIDYKQLKLIEKLGLSILY